MALACRGAAGCHWLQAPKDKSDEAIFTIVSLVGNTKPLMEDVLSVGDRSQAEGRESHTGQGHRRRSRKMEVHRAGRGTRAQRVRSRPHGLGLSLEQRRKPWAYKVCTTSFQEGAGLGLGVRGLM